jgi:hypothetical protein
MTSENRISHRVQAAIGKIKKLVGRGRDEDYVSWVGSSKRKATEPASKDIRATVES